MHSMLAVFALFAYFATTSVAIKIKTQSELTADELDELLWDGQDVELDLPSNGTHTGSQHGALVGLNQTLRPNHKHVIVMGAMDTGTNLMDKMLRSNFPSLVTTRPVWKHTVNEDPKHLERKFEQAGMPPQDVVLVIMTRTPIAQYSSWKKAPYEMGPCFRRDFQVWDTQCSPNFIWCTDLPQHFESTLAIYNMYTKQTYQVEQQSAFHRVVPVAYEDVVYTPERVFEKIAAAAEWPMPENGIDVRERSAKNHGASRGRDFALNKLQSRSFLQDFTPEQRSTLCSHIQPQWMANMVEGSFTAASRSYMADCS